MSRSAAKRTGPRADFTAEFYARFAAALADRPPLLVIGQKFTYHIPGLVKQPCATGSSARSAVDQPQSPAQSLARAGENSLSRRLIRNKPSDSERADQLIHHRDGERRRIGQVQSGQQVFDAGYEAGPARFHPIARHLRHARHFASERWHRTARFWRPDMRVGQVGFDQADKCRPRIGIVEMLQETRIPILEGLRDRLGNQSLL